MHPTTSVVTHPVGFVCHGPTHCGYCNPQLAIAQSKALLATTSPYNTYKPRTRSSFTSQTGQLPHKFCRAPICMCSVFFILLALSLFIALGVLMSNGTIVQSGFDTKNTHMFPALLVPAMFSIFFALCSGAFFLQIFCAEKATASFEQAYNEVQMKHTASPQNSAPTPAT